MNISPRPLITVPSDGEDLGVQLPRLKNWQLANHDFIDHGLCLVYPSLDFFSNSVASKAECRAVCEGCSVRYECLEFSLVTEQEYGMWGGYDEKERKTMIKEMRKELAG